MDDCSKKIIATPFKMKFHCDWWGWCRILTQFIELRQLQCAVILYIQNSSNNQAPYKVIRWTV